MTESVRGSTGLDLRRSMGFMRRAALVLFMSTAATGCKFPYPADVPDDDVVSLDAPSALDAATDAPDNRRAVGGTVTGLWTGGTVMLHLQAGAAAEDLVASSAAPFSFVGRIADATNYVVTVADDGPDHDCSITNGSGRVMGADVTNVTVTCTNLIPHSLAISSAVPFSFDPRTTVYPIPASFLQQEVSALVTGPTLTAATLAGQPITVGTPSAPAAIAAGQSTVSIGVSKGGLSQRYDLAFDRGALPIAEALYARASNPDSSDGFGISVAASDDYVAVGAYAEDSSTTAGNDNGTPDSGAVYIFRRTADAWIYSQRLKGSAITATRNFGLSLAMDGDVLVVGADGDDARGADAGAAYVFRLNRGSGTWFEQQRFTASDGRAGDRFGFAVAVSGDLLAVGAPFRETSPGSGMFQGAIYTYRYNGATWIGEPTLRPGSGLYGYRLALRGELLASATQSPYDTIYVYRRVLGAWVPENFPNVAGASVAVDGDTIAIGKMPANSPGSVHMFTRTGGIWTDVATLEANPATGGRNLGLFVALRGDIVLTNDTATPALLWRRVGGSWVPLPRPALSVSSGSPTFRIALAGNGFVVGNAGDGGPNNAMPGSGTAWIFR